MRRSAPLCAALRAAGAAVLQAPPGGRQEHRRAAGPARGGLGGRPALAHARAAATGGTRGRAPDGRDPRRGRRPHRRLSHAPGYARLAATRIEVITEGILTRLLQADPALEDVAVVIFDEFHERSLQADLGLALTLDARAQLNPLLRVLVMSATLDGEAVARLLGDAPLISAPGRAYAVTTHFHGSGLPPLPSGSGACDRQRRAARYADDRTRPRRGERRHPGVPAGSGRDPPRARTACRRGCHPARRSCRCSGNCRASSRTPRCNRPPRGSARWCSPPTSPRPASPYPACASWSIRASCAARASTRSPA